MTAGTIESYFTMTLILSLSLFAVACARTYDYIVVGSGSAGSVVANRLSADPSISVLLLEAGGEPRLISEIPFFSEYQRTSPISWNYTTIPQKNAAQGLVNRVSLVPRGKVLGGGGTMNDNFYTRGNRYDYDQWAAQGAIGWDWKGVFPYFFKHEDNGNPYFATNGYHNFGGDQPINEPPFHSPITSAYLEAAELLGYSRGDYNGANQSVFMLPQGTLKSGRRYSSYRAFIEPLKGRRNILILTYARATKILIDGKKKAYGVLFVRHNKVYTALATEEVILCAGVFNSAQLLILSGIGRKHELEKFNIPVISNLPVGENLQDHPTTLGQIFTSDSYTYRDGRITKDDFMNILLYGIGPLTTILATEAVGFIKTKHGHIEYPDMEILWRTSPFAQDEETFRLLYNGNRALWKALEPYAARDVITCNPVLLHPRSRGRMWLASKNPFDPPIIDPNYYSHPLDIKVMVEGMKFCLEMALQEPMKRKGVKPIPVQIPGCERYKPFSDDYLACVGKTVFSSFDHHSGTCKMGDPTDSTTVVDPLLRVKGVHSLRVVDASIMPIVITGHTHGPTVMIGEKGSDLILQDLYHRRKLRKTKFH